MRLLVARHGATQHNLDARFTGQTDAPLSDLGLKQAEALGVRLRGEPLDAIVASDMARAQATAAAVAQRHELTAQLDPDLREIAMGAWEGQTVAHVQAAFPGLYARVRDDPRGAAGAPGGETWADFAVRVDRALARWQKQFPDGNVLWITHGGVISVLLLRALNLEFSLRDRFRRANTGLFELEYGRAGAVLARANDTCHLDEAGLADRGERSQAL